MNLMQISAVSSLVLTCALSQWTCALSEQSFSRNFLLIISGKANNSKVKAPQHQNDSMMKELQTLRNELSRLQASFRSHETEVSKHGGQSQPGPDPETTKTLQFVRDEYDDLTGFCKAVKKDLAAFKNRLESLTV